MNIAFDGALTSRNISVYSFDCVDSTNTVARKMTVSGDASLPSLFVADAQTGGRGRMGRSFYSPSGTGIYMSVALDVTDDGIPSVTRMTSAAAVAVSRAIESVTGISVGIKWVNDLYLNGRKVCGILAESFAARDRRYAVVGVGINLSTADFPDDIRAVAGSINNDADSDIRRRLALSVGCELFDAFERLRDGDFAYMDEYRARSVVIGKSVDIITNGAVSTGVAVSVEDDGALRIVLDDGSERVLSSGEISLRLR